MVLEKPRTRNPAATTGCSITLQLNNKLCERRYKLCWGASVVVKTSGVPSPPPRIQSWSIIFHCRTRGSGAVFRNVVQRPVDKICARVQPRTRVQCVVHNVFGTIALSVTVIVIRRGIETRSRQTCNWKSSRGLQVPVRDFWPHRDIRFVSRAFARFTRVIIKHPRESETL